jgi:hypothetical protein
VGFPEEGACTECEGWAVCAGKMDGGVARQRGTLGLARSTHKEGLGADQWSHSLLPQ